MIGYKERSEMMRFCSSDGDISKGWKSMKEDWRQLKWKDFSKEQRLWFVVAGAEVVVIICLALVFPCFGIEIPNWAAALMIIPMIIPVYKLIQV
ncbi:MAG: hypothetical protein IJ973_02065 [Christensenellaceae bacterium]|nr:hypothetical protein [Christensenellaceae bacterium]